ncbi:hypothetical protein NK718_21795, partial [Alsobacter sp. SYSU M60028]
MTIAAKNSKRFLLFGVCFQMKVVRIASIAIMASLFVSPAAFAQDLGVVSKEVVQPLPWAEASDSGVGSG